MILQYFKTRENKEQIIARNQYKKILYESKNFLNENNFFKIKNYNVYLVNADGEKFIEENWKLGETYNYFKQSKSIISDKHSRKYDALNDNDKQISRKRVWGI